VKAPEHQEEEGRAGGVAAVGVLRARFARCWSDPPTAALRIPRAGNVLGGLLAGMLLLAALGLPSPAQAVDRQDPRAAGTMKLTAHYLEDLSGGEGPDRLFAARVLRQRVKRARSMEQSGDELASMEARALLDELSRELPGRCAVAMSQESVIVPCADALRRLDASEAVPALQAARATAKRSRSLRAIDRALQALGAPADPVNAPPEASSAPEAPGAPPPPPPG
jgi:hypothetical protein